METDMTAENQKQENIGTDASARPKRARRFTLKRLGYAALIAIAVFCLGKIAWTASGSNEWELVRNEDGVQVWTKKSPGSEYIRVKAKVRIKARLSSMIKLLEDLESCVDAYCYDTKVIRQLEMLPGYYGKYVRFKFDPPIPGFKTREYVLFAEHYQDPASRKIEINILSAPDMIPRDACCIRVTHLHNNWKLTPLPNNELDIEFTQDTDLGGMNFILANFALKEGMFKVLHDMQGMMNMDKYKNAKVDYIIEPGELETNPSAQRAAVGPNPHHDLEKR